MHLINYAIFLAFILHNLSCLENMLAEIEMQSFQNTWIQKAQDIDATSSFSRYIAGLYWSITTIATVGFGDISAHTTLERIYCIIMMAFGIAVYSVNLTKLSAIFLREDEKHKVLNEQLEWLESLEDKYKISTDLGMRVKKALKFYHIKKSLDTSQVMNILPKQLYFELNVSIYRDIIESFNFFRNKPQQFIANLIPYLINIRIYKGDYICKEGSNAIELYFLYDGIAGAIFESQLDDEEYAFPYYVIERGSMYGEFNEDMSCKAYHMHNIIALKDCELMVLKMGVTNSTGLLYNIRPIPRNRQRNIQRVQTTMGKDTSK